MSWQQLTLTLPSDSEIGTQVFPAAQNYHCSGKKSSSYLLVTSSTLAIDCEDRNKTEKYVQKKNKGLLLQGKC